MVGNQNEAPDDDDDVGDDDDDDDENNVEVRTTLTATIDRRNFPSSATSTRATRTSFSTARFRTGRSTLASKR